MLIGAVTTITTPVEHPWCAGPVSTASAGSATTAVACIGSDACIARVTVKGALTRRVDATTSAAKAQVARTMIVRGRSALATSSLFSKLRLKSGLEFGIAARAAIACNCTLCAAHADADKKSQGP